MKFLVILEIVLLASQLQYVCVESNLATSLIKAGSRTAGTVTKNLVGGKHQKLKKNVCLNCQIIILGVIRYCRCA